MFIRLPLLALLLLAPGVALGGEQPESQRILECVGDNLPDSPRVIDAIVRSRGLETPEARSEHIRVEASVQGRGRQLAIRLIVTAPEDLAGSAYLFRQAADDAKLHFYSPELDRVRAVRGGREGSGVLDSALSLSDFNDVERTLRSSSISLRRQHDDDPAHHRRFTVLPPSSSAAPFGRIDMTVDTERCFVIAADVRGHDGELLRRLRIPETALSRHANGYWYPQQLIVEDHSRNRHSIVEIESLELPATLPAARFSPDDFFRRD